MLQLIAQYATWPAIAALAGAAALLWAWASGRRSARQAAGLRDLRGDIKAHERINDAEDGSDMDDGARSDWLREFAARNKRP